MKEPKMKQGSSVGQIERVEPSQETPTPESKWLPVLKAFNPFGPIAESYARRLAYKIETKRLNIELTRINKQAEITHNVIDKTFRLKMEELQHRRIALVGFYQTVNAEFEKQNIKSNEILKMAQLAQAKAFEPDLSLEEMQLYSEMCLELTREHRKCGDKPYESFKNLVEVLPPVEVPAHLLGD